MANKYEILASLMFTPNNRDKWASYLNDNFSVIEGKTFEDTIERISTERDLINQDTGLDNSVKIKRLVPALKSTLSENE